MTMKRFGAVAVCAVFTACGGSKSGNAAAGTEFTYPDGPGETLNSEASATISSQLKDAAGASSSPTASNPSDLSSYNGISGALLPESEYLGILDSSSLPASSSMRRFAIARLTEKGVPATAGLDDESCVTETDTSVTFNHCTETITEGGSGTYSIHGSVSASNQTLTWNLTFTADITITSNQTTLKGTFSTSGKITVTATTDTTGTIVGSQEASIDFTYTSKGTTISLAVAESVDLNVGYDTVCDSYIVSGTLEAKRVWTKRPQGVSATQAPDVAAKAEWTGCGVGTFKLGTKS